MFKFQKLSDSSCSEEKPAGPTQRSCNAIICPAEWKPTAWSKVRDLDGEGKDRNNFENNYCSSVTSSQ